MHVPLARCLIPKALFKNLGMVRDMNSGRRSVARMTIQKSLVATAWEIIYKNKLCRRLRGMDTLLKEQSLVHRR